ncbi:MAG: hypothetical protein PHR77_18880 [Kiritimatiellae bacterium]|nr:hypothetical protein [Kiritimatiellia bacterium]MDD5523184.1 hypothetical protein [Kiritimatiellia bacterium]
MRRQICWVEKLEDGIKRDIRVSFVGGGKIKWQFKRSDMAEWDYDTPPALDDWDALLIRSEGRYNRRRMPLTDLELVRKARKEASAD